MNITAQQIQQLADGLPPFSIGLDYEEAITWLAKALISLDKQMSVLEQTGIADRDLAQKTEAQQAELAKQEPVAWRIGGDGCPEHLSGDKKYAYEYPKRTIEQLFLRAAPPAPVVGGRTMPRHEFSQMVNELRDVPAVQSKREKIVSILRAFNINPAGGSVADE